MTVAQHGNRQILRHEKKGPVTVIADRFQGRRFNSPNDLVYRSDGALGLAFSPDEKYLYVSNWDVGHYHDRNVVMRYAVAKNGSVTESKEFIDMSSKQFNEGLDGVKVDELGNVYVSGPGAVWIVSPAGQLLGKIKAPKRPANMSWGDDGRSLYLTAHEDLYRIRLKVKGSVYAGSDRDEVAGGGRQ